MNTSEEYWQIWIDTGGTFTDCLGRDPHGEWQHTKVLSNSSLRGKILNERSSTHLRIKEDWNAPDNFIKGFKFNLLDRSHATINVHSYDSTDSILVLESALQVSEAEGLSFEIKTSFEAPSLAAHLVTQTPLDRPLPPIEMRLATTKGTNALLEEKGADTALFITDGFEDLLDIGTQQRDDLFSLDINKASPIYKEVIEVPERMDAKGNVLKAISFDKLEYKVEQLLSRGIQTAAVSFMHSYQNNQHEKELGSWLLNKGFTHVISSSDLSHFIKILTRTETTLTNAYLEPVIQSYLNSVKKHINRGTLYVMTSAGGLMETSNFNPKDSLLSGPAGGVVGASAIGKKAGYEKIISFDMGGTSTDVSRFDKDFDYVFEHQVGKAQLAAPAIAIETVAAGGGSICSYDGYSLSVGPESAGADPGPACYGAGGPLTLTDVNLLLGRLDPSNFSIPVSLEKARERLDQLKNQVNQSSNDETDENEILLGLLDIANERMAEAIKKISVSKGYDTGEYALVGFGGAGGQHICSIARRLQIDTVLIPSEAGILSAYGLGQAVLEQFAEEQILRALPEIQDQIENRFEKLDEKAIERLKSDSVEPSEIHIRRRILSMRLSGQESTLDIEYTPQRSIREVFQEKYHQRYGHWISNRTIEVESIRVIASTKREIKQETLEEDKHYTPNPDFHKSTYFEKGYQHRTPVFYRSTLSPGAVINGPALILDPYSTLIIEHSWKGQVDSAGILRITRQYDEKHGTALRRPRAAKLELFINRFSSIAEEMGEMLKRTALSVNIKEREDFSCALLNPDGELIVNAPHIPVHLGALGLCVRTMRNHISLNPGDVVVTNHPAYGGSHLPDVTVITPIFTESETLLGFAASRAHHAEIGGVRPGSMPPMATKLSEEGVVISPTYLIKEGEERWQDIEDKLRDFPYPSRNVEENIADLQAAVAANHRGVRSIRSLVEKHSISKVRHYMNKLRDYASDKMKYTLRQIGNGEYSSTEYLDDDTPLHVNITVEDEHITFDFEGTGNQHPGNLNATPAIVNSVIIYILRLLVNEPLPLNEGLLQPVTINLPSSLLNPHFEDESERCPAVVGGNIETSQRLVDTLLKPFERIACSQGTMNNVLFGNENFGYYETIGGGTGAGPNFNGIDAVHHHMTNTRATDPEILEFRYPVRLDKYAIRRNSGGSGKYSGGNGIIRKLTFLQEVQLSVLSQHRKYAPYGLKGGEQGKVGKQWIARKNGTKEELHSIDGSRLKAGDQFVIHTPGGGGFGEKPK